MARRNATLERPATFVRTRALAAPGSREAHLMPSVVEQYGEPRTPAPPSAGDGPPREMPVSEATIRALMQHLAADSVTARQMQVNPAQALRKVPFLTERDRRSLSTLDPEIMRSLAEAAERYARDAGPKYGLPMPDPWRRGGKYGFIFNDPSSGVTGLPGRTKRERSLDLDAYDREGLGQPSFEAEIGDFLKSLERAGFNGSGRRGWQSWLSGGGRMPSGGGRAGGGSSRPGPSWDDGGRAPISPGFGHRMGDPGGMGGGTGARDPRVPPVHPEDDPNNFLLPRDSEEWDRQIETYDREMARHREYWDHHGGEEGRREFLWRQYAENYARAYEEYLKKKAEERKKKEGEDDDPQDDTEKKKKPAATTTPNPEDPDGPEGPWLRGRRGARNSERALPNPEDTGGGGPIAPWLRGAHAPVLNSRAMPNPEDDRGPIGPQARVRAGSRFWLYPAPDDPNPGGPTARSTRRRG